MRNAIPRSNSRSTCRISILNSSASPPPISHHRGGRARLGVAVIIEPKQADGSYTVDHSSAIFVLDPNGKLAAILTGPFTVEALQADFQRIVAGPA